MGRYLRVVTLDDGTVHNAFPDRDFSGADTDSLYIDLADRPSMNSREVLPGIVLDLDDGGSLVGIDIDHASRKFDLPRSEAGSVPFEARTRRAG